MERKRKGPYGKRKYTYNVDDDADFSIDVDEMSDAIVFDQDVLNNEDDISVEPLADDSQEIVLADGSSEKGNAFIPKDHEVDNDIAFCSGTVGNKDGNAIFEDGDVEVADAVEHNSTEQEAQGCSTGEQEILIDNDLEGQSDIFEDIDEFISDDVLDDCFESDTEVLEIECLNSTDAEAEPLYPGATVTLGAIMLLLALFVTKYNLAGEGIQQLLNILAVALPNGHTMCTSVHSFKTFFRNLKNPLVKHYYCGYCLGYLKDPSLATCPYSMCKKNMSLNKEYFLEMPIENQLKNLFSQDGFYSDLQGRFKPRKVGTFNDIYDGSLYKSYFENMGPLNCPNNISFTFNTDGASVFKSSNVSVWPLFLVINELPYKLRMKKENMILAGLWFGNKKPSMGTFLNPFLETFNALERGINVFSPENGHFTVKAFLLCGTADLPARCLLCNSVQFNGSFSCWKCLQSGETAKVGKGHCHIFPFKEDGPKLPQRTKDSVVQDCQIALEKQESGNKKYLVNGIKGPSWLMLFPKFDIVDGIAVDYMHGVLLGIQKLLLNLWFSTTYKGKPYNFYDKVCQVDERLSKVRPTLSISRLPRSIQNELKYWKASEYRSFLLYYGAPVLNGILDNDRFIHFLLLVHSIFILLKCGSNEEDIISAERMLFQFVRQFSLLYDQCFMTLNMHQLLHLPDSVRCLGPLFTHSCFPFEDKNGVLLRMIRGTQNIDNQIITGVSFLQKLPELKKSTIERDSNLEKLCNSIEHPTILTRGSKLANNIYVLGAVKSRTLTDTEHAAVSACLGYDPAIEKYRYFKRLEYHNCLIYGTAYSRMVKRDNSTICYTLDGKDELFGRVRFFISLGDDDHSDDLSVLAFVEELNLCNQFCKSNILAVEKKDSVRAIPIECITDSCIYVSVNDKNSHKDFVCRFPNGLESD